MRKLRKCHTLTTNKQNISPGRQDRWGEQSLGNLEEDEKGVLFGEHEENQWKNKKGVDCEPERDNKIMIMVKNIQWKNIH